MCFFTRFVTACCLFITLTLMSDQLLTVISGCCSRNGAISFFAVITQKQSPYIILETAVHFKKHRLCDKNIPLSLSDMVTVAVLRFSSILVMFASVHSPTPNDLLQRKWGKYRFRKLRFPVSQKRLWARTLWISPFDSQSKPTIVWSTLSSTGALLWHKCNTFYSSKVAIHVAQQYTVNRTKKRITPFNSPSQNFLTMCHRILAKTCRFQEVAENVQISPISGTAKTGCMNLQVMEIAGTGFWQ